MAKELIAEHSVAGCRGAEHERTRRARDRVAHRGDRPPSRRSAQPWRHLKRLRGWRHLRQLRPCPVAARQATRDTRRRLRLGGALWSEARSRLLGREFDDAAHRNSGLYPFCLPAPQQLEGALCAKAKGQVINSRGAEKAPLRLRAHLHGERSSSSALQAVRGVKRQEASHIVWVALRDLAPVQGPHSEESGMASEDTLPPGEAHRFEDLLGYAEHGIASRTRSMLMSGHECCS